jgi:hypothetical protein
MGVFRGMNKLASKILWWQGVVLAVLTLVRLIAWLMGLGRELILIGLFTAVCLAYAALSMALSRTRLCGLSPWLAVLSSFGLGFGFLIIGFFAPIAPIASPPLVIIVGSQMAFVALAAITGSVMDCKQEPGKRMDKPLRVASLLLAMYVWACGLMRVMTTTWFSWNHRSMSDILTKSFYEIILLFLSAAGVMLSLSSRWPKDSTALSYIVAAAFVVGAMFFAGASSVWYVEGISEGVLSRTILGVALLFPSFLRRYSRQGS